jgi:hypothetical protein
VKSGCASCGGSARTRSDGQTGAAGVNEKYPREVAGVGSITNNETGCSPPITKHRVLAELRQNAYRGAECRGSLFMTSPSNLKEPKHRVIRYSSRPN